MAADLARSAQSGITVQLCGDAHLSNFGGFAGPARRLLFDLNDFDVTLPGPWEWDVKRLAASLAVAARQRRFGGSDRGVRIGRPQIVDERVRELFRAYRGTLGGELRRLLESYRYMDFAHEVVGLGSVGARAWIVLMLGRDADDHSSSR